jgi:hypothetical protein
MARNPVSASMSSRQTHNFSQKPGFFQASFLIKVSPEALGSTAEASGSPHSGQREEMNAREPVECSVTNVRSRSVSAGLSTREGNSDETRNLLW